MKQVPGLTLVSRGKTGDGGAGGRSTYSQVQDQLGIAICGGLLEPGTVLTIDDLETATGASRSIIRESTRVLASMGLFRARQRVGFQVLPQTEWNFFDPQVIRWRLMSPDRQEQVRALLEVRIAIEPEAARLAAERASAELAGKIMSSAGALWSSGVHGDQREFLVHDSEFHDLILLASGNPMFARLSNVIQEALRERALHQLLEQPVNDEDVQLHVDLANHIQRRQGDSAWAVSREIIVRNAPSAP
ncbi:FadR/GntR family transcriptional regulator [Compostimonas suwonensis]|uniref:DNA-binding FadR family transcriptional regulator n=1 Tax=Compostimonas suwonensis TaxID=1048394 RepID=A0A2M9C530_9MICO|nr:FCD domain-containing protein [Compostimonas suwonensis]PJJ65628.1 DNA-binding FadR family transcriptional regulator [Compostimonas suwonensis]